MIWNRRKLDRAADQIIADVEARKKSFRQWSDGYIPLPANYLDEERWLDEWSADPVRAGPRDWQKWGHEHCPPRTGETMEEWQARVRSARREAS